MQRWVGWPNYLPGHPLVSLDDRRGLLEFLEREYCSADLDRVVDVETGQCEHLAAAPTIREGTKHRRDRGSEAAPGVDLLI